MPVLGLGVVVLKMSKQESVRQVPAAGTVIGHDIGRACNVVIGGKVAMGALMEAGPS